MDLNFDEDQAGEEAIELTCSAAVPGDARSQNVSTSFWVSSDKLRTTRLLRASSPPPASPSQASRRRIRRRQMESRTVSGLPWILDVHHSP